MEQYSFGYWLKLRRKALDLTREALADRAGYSAETIRKIETEQRRPSSEMAERLADILNIPQDERTAFLRFARGDWRSTPSSREEEAPWRVSTPALPQQPRSNVPATFTSLIGRDKDIAAVHDYLTNPDIRLVTLIGPGGIEDAPEYRVSEQVTGRVLRWCFFCRAGSAGSAILDPFCHFTSAWIY